MGPLHGLAAGGGGAGKPKPWGISVAAGYTNLAFSGVTGSNFSAFNHYNWDFALHYFRQKGWQWFGLGTTQVPNLTFKNFLWTTGTSGNYSASFQTNYIFAGGAHKKFRWALLAGYESITWKGSPSSGPSKPEYFTTGLLMGWEWKTKGRMSFPIYGRYWKKPFRKITFAEFPDDTINAQPGTAFDLSMGVHFGF
jgi:hypothetical protein